MRRVYVARRASFGAAHAARVGGGARTKRASARTARCRAELRVAIVGGAHVGDQLLHLVASRLRPSSSTPVHQARAAAAPESWPVELRSRPRRAPALRPAHRVGGGGGGSGGGASGSEYKIKKKTFDLLPDGEANIGRLRAAERRSRG